MIRSLFFVLIIAIACNTPSSVQNNPDNSNTPDQQNNIFSCKIDTAAVILSENCQPNMDCSFTAQSGHTIDIELYQNSISKAEVIPGYAQTFYINRTFRDNPNIADDEFTEKLLFEIPTSLSKFQIQNEEFKQAKMVYATLAYSRDGGYYPVKSGCMEGFKLENGSWKVQGEITIITRTKREITRTIQAIFTTQ